MSCRPPSSTCIVEKESQRERESEISCNSGDVIFFGAVAIQQESIFGVARLVGIFLIYKRIDVTSLFFFVVPPLFYSLFNHIAFEQKATRESRQTDRQTRRVGRLRKGCGSRLLIFGRQVRRLPTVGNMSPGSICARVSWVCYIFDCYMVKVVCMHILIAFSSVSVFFRWHQTSRKRRADIKLMLAPGISGIPGIFSNRKNFPI